MPWRAVVSSFRDGTRRRAACSTRWVAVIRPPLGRLLMFRRLRKPPEALLALREVAASSPHSAVDPSCASSGSVLVVPLARSPSRFLSNLAPPGRHRQRGFACDVPHFPFFSALHTVQRGPLLRFAVLSTSGSVPTAFPGALSELDCCRSLGDEDKPLRAPRMLASSDVSLAPGCGKSFMSVWSGVDGPSFAAATLSATHVSPPKLSGASLDEPAMAAMDGHAELLCRFASICSNTELGSNISNFPCCSVETMGSSPARSKIHRQRNRINSEDQGSENRKYERLNLEGLARKKLLSSA
eukprot:1178402-Prorocentrum_minimum.AAC.2